MQSLKQVFIMAEQEAHRSSSFPLHFKDYANLVIIKYLERWGWSHYERTFGCIILLLGSIEGM
jgi:hypothetical protein